MRVSIVIPFKNRAEFLNLLLQYLPQYLEDNGIKDYFIVVSEQSDDSIFNRSISINAGAKYSIEHLQPDYLIVHDVDILPVKNVDYLYQSFFMPRFISAGGVNCSVADFVKLNGYCNTYVGWGYEDTDFIKRAKFYNIEIKEWRELAQIHKPIMVNMEYSEEYDSLEASLSYWGSEWPRYIKPSEFNLPQIKVNKVHNWYIREYMDANRSRLELYCSMQKKDRDAHYQSSGFKQLKSEFININSIKNRVHMICYDTNKMFENGTGSSMIGWWKNSGKKRFI